MSARAGSANSLLALRPPYDTLEAINPLGVTKLGWGDALVLDVNRKGIETVLQEALSARRPETPLYVILPPPVMFRAAGHTLAEQVIELEPDGVFPHTRDLWPDALRYSLSLPPADPPLAASLYIARSRERMPEHVFDTVVQVFRAAETLSTVNRLARHLCMSRRTLGRLFLTHGLPQPSHWLQFARVFRVCLRLHSTRDTISTSAVWGGYPDAFTFSNQMNRLLGVRPTCAKHWLGWKWPIQVWLQREASDLTAGDDGVM